MRDYFLSSCLPDPSRRLQLTQCTLVEKARSVDEFKCEIKHSIHCECIHRSFGIVMGLFHLLMNKVIMFRSECETVKYKECVEEPKPVRCQKKRILVS
jgi:hypothetical protein